MGEPVGVSDEKRLEGEPINQTVLRRGRGRFLYFLRSPMAFGVGLRLPLLGPLLGGALLEPALRPLFGPIIDFRRRWFFNRLQ